VFIHFDGFFLIPGHEKSRADAIAQSRARDPGHAIPDSEDPPPTADPPAEPGKQPRRITDLQKDVTAILVQTKTDSLAFLMLGWIEKNDPWLQAANPIAQIHKLLRDVVGNIRTMLLVMTVLIIIVSGVGIFVSIYNSMADRKREIAIMRALGARRSTVFSIIIAESVLLCVAGGVIGLALGHALVFIAGPIVESRSDMLIDPWAFETQELIIFPALFLLAIVVGVFPGLTAYRADVARGLSD
jgi:putative ABC transport system permease protein